MRYIFSIAFFLYFFLISNSQELFPIGTEWTYTITYWGQDYAVNKLTIVSDTTINGQPCKILERDFVTCDCRPIREYIYESEDTLFFYNEFLNTFNILYIFNMDLSQMYTLNMWHGFGIDSFWVEIYSRDTILINNNIVAIDNVRIIDIQNVSIFRETSVINQIGGIKNLFLFASNNSCDGYHMKELRCFFHPDEGEIKFVSEPCDMLTSVTTLPTTEITCFPTPANKYIRIKDLKHGNYFYRILSQDGTIMGYDYLRDEQFPNPVLGINLLNKGLYYLQIVDLSNPREFHAKFVKM